MPEPQKKFYGGAFYLLYRQHALIVGRLMRRPGFMKYQRAIRHRRWRRRLQDVLLHRADDMHLAWLTIKFERIFFFACYQRHWLGLHLSLHTFDTFGLLWTQVKRETQAMLGDH